MEIIRTTESERLRVTRLLQELAELDESEAKAGRAVESGRSRSGVEGTSEARLRRMQSQVAAPGQGAA